MVGDARADRPEVPDGADASRGARVRWRPPPGARPPAVAGASSPAPIVGVAAESPGRARIGGFPYGTRFVGKSLAAAMAC